LCVPCLCWRRRSHSSSAPSKSQAQHVNAPSFDLLGSPTSELPNPNRFELTRENSDGEIVGRTSSDPDGLMSLRGDGPPSPVLSSHTIDVANRDREHTTASANLSNSITLPTRPQKQEKRPRFSLEFPRHKFSRSTSQSHQPASPSSRRGRSNSTRTASGGRYDYDYEDDAAGDLGYAAASDMEGQKRKVIVERLEAVKSRRPVFTWC